MQSEAIQQDQTGSNPSGPIHIFILLEDSLTRFDPALCEFCGMPIDVRDQPCAALHEGVCRP